MKAILYDQFGGPVYPDRVADPDPREGSVVVAVKASGICRSDWHGWMGHDADIRELPHVPGHELAGEIAAVGKGVRGFRVGDRVTVPFVAGCGVCPDCREGNPQVCPDQSQPGFTHWGSFAEYVRIDYAESNLVHIPDALDFESAAILGCRFSTAFRATLVQGAAQAGQWVVVFGCGGVGLSAIMIAAARQARVIAVDIRPEALALAARLGAEVLLQTGEGEVREAIYQNTGRGAHLTIDALGKASVCREAIESLRRGGRHVQVGLLAGADFQPRLPMERVISRELQILGSHGMQAGHFPQMLEMISAGQLAPEKLITRRIALEEVPPILTGMDDFAAPGVTVINRF
ncbi:MAG TPA: alcohol dehydrogenase catalytic domain-containing protein [Calditrichia bacterium]|nr:alcohol dehydrogenase catalytic domain-containing protein [Calditrichia bacterium]